MSEVYFISGGEIPPDIHDLNGWLEQRGIKPAWLQEIHWLSVDTAPVNNRLPPLTHWQVVGTTAHRLLHLIMGEFILNKSEMALIAQSSQGGCFGMILGSPAALGRRNLLPGARLTGLSGAAGGESPLIAAWAHTELDALEVEPPAVRMLYTLTGLAERESMEFNNLFPKIQQKTAINQIQGIASLAENDLSEGESGLFLEKTRGLATWVEKL